MTDYYACRECNGDVRYCGHLTPSARITGDKDRSVQSRAPNTKDLYATVRSDSDLIIGGVYGEGLIGRIDQLETVNRVLAIECHRLGNVLRYIADAGYVDHQSGNQNFEYLQEIARDGLAVKVAPQPQPENRA